MNKNLVVQRGVEPLTDLFEKTLDIFFDQIAHPRAYWTILLSKIVLLN